MSREQTTPEISKLAFISGLSGTYPTKSKFQTLKFAIPHT